MVLIVLKPHFDYKSEISIDKVVFQIGLQLYIRLETGVSLLEGVAISVNPSNGQAGGERGFPSIVFGAASATI